MTTVVKETYVRNATVIRVVDGDTVNMNVDLGCDISVNLSCRLEGIDAPETSTAAGKVSRAWLVKKLPCGMPVTVQTTKDRKEKYGRYLATIFVPGQTESVNDQLVTEGLAKAYDGGKR